jgi:hypothetical protein
MKVSEDYYATALVKIGQGFHQCVAKRINLFLPDVNEMEAKKSEIFRFHFIQVVPP